MAEDENGRGQWSTALLGAAGNTLPEHHSCAGVLLQQLDHAWFRDNLLKPRVSLFNAFRSSPHPFRAPYQSIELMDATHSKWGSSTPHRHSTHGGMPMPCPRFEGLPHSKAPANGTPHLSKEDAGNSLQSLRKLRKVASVVRPLPPRFHMSPNPRRDTILHPPARIQTWSATDSRSKDFQDYQISQKLKLDRIDSGKQLRVSLIDGPLPQQTARMFRTRKAQRNTSSKSMTTLEFDELHGLMDLGFQSSQDDLTPRIVTMFPALQHKLGEHAGFDSGPRAIYSKSKHNLLDAWLVRGSLAPLHHWHFPTTNEDMKEHLKFWARAVASTARQEC